MVLSKTYTGTAGLSYIIAPEIAYSTILGVKREGLGYTEETVIGNRAFVYTTAEGKIEFENVFVGGYDPTSSTDIPPETVFVLYKI